MRANLEYISVELSEKARKEQPSPRSAHAYEQISKLEDTEVERH
jgi:hypothetical protein